MILPSSSVAVAIAGTFPGENAVQFYYKVSGGRETNTTGTWKVQTLKDVVVVV